MTILFSWCHRTYQHGSRPPHGNNERTQATCSVFEVTG